MSSFYFVVMCLAALVVDTIAVTSEEKAKFREAVAPIISECASQYDMTVEQIKAAREAWTLEQLDPCFFACFFKKTNVINDEGVYDADAAIEKTKKYVSDATDLEKFNTIHKACLSVNDAATSDGKKGCDRAKLLISCLLEHKEEFSPFTL